MFAPEQIKRYACDVNVIKYFDGLEKKEIKKMIVYPIEIGSKVDFTTKGGTVIFTIPMKELVGFNFLSEKTGLLKKQTKMIEMVIKSTNEQDKTITIKIEDELIQEVTNQLKKQVEMQITYWSTIPVHYTLNGILTTANVPAQAPFLAEGEETL